MFKIDIKTDIIPKGRPRFWQGRTITPPETRDCERKLSAYFKLYMRDKVMIPKGINIIFSAEIFVTHNRGDLSNYVKILEDSANKILWYDDKFVTGYDKIRLHRKQKYGRIILWIKPINYLLD